MYPHLSPTACTHLIISASSALLHANLSAFGLGGAFGAAEPDAALATPFTSPNAPSGSVPVKPSASATADA